MKLRYIGPFGNHTGYARAGHDYLLALHRYTNIEIDIQPTHDYEEDEVDPFYAELHQFVEKEGDLDWPDVVLVHSTPYGAHWYVTDDLAPTSAKKVLMTTWETSHLHSDIWHQVATAFDQVIVPSKFCADVLDFDNMAVIPHCYFQEEWHSKLAVDNSGPYRFLWVGAWVERKNPLGLLKAYLTQFPDTHNVLLTIKTGLGQVEQDIVSLKRCLNLDYYPPIELIQDYLSRDELIRLHKQSNCYVTAHRGEGFCLGAFESWLAGNRVISTDFGGQMEFINADSKGCRTITSQRTPAVVPEITTLEYNDAGQLCQRVSRKDPTGMAGNQYWAEPDLWVLQCNMRDVYGQNRRRKIPRKTEHFEAESVAKQLAEALEG